MKKQNKNPKTSSKNSNISDTAQQESSDFLFAKFITSLQAGNASEAEAIYNHLLTSYPKNAHVLIFLGIFQMFRNTAEAVRLFEKAIALDASNPVAYQNHANALLLLNRYDDALKSYDNAIAINSGNAEIYNNRAFILRKLKQYNEALASCDKAIAINPNYADAYNMRANILQDLKQYNAAVEAYDKAIAANPGFATAYSNRGFLLNALKRHSEALADYDKAIAINPDYADAYLNKSLLKLLLGEYEEGWQLHEWRRKRSELKPDEISSFVQPLWLGKESLAGKTILLQAEQGLGDTIQFCRYVPLVQALEANVILEVQPLLAELISTSIKSVQTIARGAPRPLFDFHCPLMSLPLAFKTTLNTIPGTVPYFFANTQKQPFWQALLGKKEKPRIGLVWSGAAGHTNDHNRSIALTLLTPLLECKCDFFSLQKEVRPSDMAVLASSKIICLTDNIKDFSDTAAFLSEMDLVISVDTSVAHLAGALAKPLWLLLPAVPDFRWMRTGEDSPWYPTAKLFRQQNIGDWESVIAKVREALTSFIH